MYTIVRSNSSLKQQTQSVKSASSSIWYRDAICHLAVDSSALHSNKVALYFVPVQSAVVNLHFDLMQAAVLSKSTVCTLPWLYHQDHRRDIMQIASVGRICIPQSVDSAYRGIKFMLHLTWSCAYDIMQWRVYSARKVKLHSLIFQLAMYWD